MLVLGQPGIVDSGQLDGSEPSKPHGFSTASYSQGAPAHTAPLAQPKNHLKKCGKDETFGIAMDRQEKSGPCPLSVTDIGTVFNTINSMRRFAMIDITTYHGNEESATNNENDKCSMIIKSQI